MKIDLASLLQEGKINCGMTRRDLLQAMAIIGATDRFTAALSPGESRVLPWVVKTLGRPIADMGIAPPPGR